MKNVSVSKAASWCLIGIGLGIQGCTYGTVTDAIGSGPIGHAAVIFATWDTSRPSTGGPAEFVAVRSAFTWAQTDHGGSAPGMYTLNPYAFDKLQPDDNTTLDNLIVPEGWQLILIEHDNYDPLFVFRNHLYQDCSVYTNTPYSMRYAPSIASGPSAGLCIEQNLRLWPDTVNYQTLPDLIVDPRTLRDYDVIQAHPNYCNNARCLRFGTGLANAGRGDFFASAPTSNMSTVHQRLFYKNGTFVDQVLPGATFQVSSHGHLHLAGLVEARLRPVTASCDTESKASACPVVLQSSKLGFCLFDHFQLHSFYGNAAKYHEASCLGIHSPTISVGLTKGFQETYDKFVIGQALNLTGVSAGTYWLEVEVNVNHTIIESDYGNNISRVQVTL